MDSRLDKAADSATFPARRLKLRAVDVPAAGLVALVGLLGLVAAGCGGGKANPPPSSDRPGTGGRTSTGTGGTSAGKGGSTSVQTGGSTGAGGAAASEIDATAPDADPVDTGADLEPVDLGPPPPNCGNSVKDPGEECDLGAGNEANAYGKDKCTKNCKLAPYCGDGSENRAQGEECDKAGANADKTYGAKTDCSATCKLVPHCGDKKVQDPPEKCDEGDDKPATSGKTGCKACQIVPALPVCGDGKKEGDEACDNGNANIDGDYAVKLAAPPAVTCNKQCKVVVKFCGDSKVDNGHEQCDKGPTGQAAQPGVPGCSAECKTTALTAFCGDGMKNVAGEDCDQGNKNRANDAPYAGNDKPSPYLDPATGKPALFCSKSCRDVHYCGDGSVQPQEACDLGQSNDPNAYGEGKCTAGCEIAPFCGDSKVAAGEKCDSGGANLDPGTQYVAGPVDVNKPPCRRGVCTVIPHCGDGFQTNNEACDNGKANVTMDYVGGTSPSGQKPPCKAVTCTPVPYCGDGQVTNNEACDPETADAKLKKNCTSDCKKIESVQKNLKVTRFSGNAACAGNDAPKCLADVNEAGGASLAVACTAGGETELEFGALGGKADGDVGLTLDGVPGTAQVTCDAPGGKVAVSNRDKLPDGCFENNRAIKIQIKSTAGTCLGLAFAQVKGKAFPN
jgi:hypothetical protein